MTLKEWHSNPELRERLAVLLEDPVLKAAESVIESSSPAFQLSRLYAETITKDSAVLAGMVAGWEKRKNMIEFLLNEPKQKPYEPPSYGVTAETAKD